MSTVLDYMVELRAGERVWADCPGCGELLTWWIPGNQELIEADPDYRDSAGLQCDGGDCGYEVSLGPPAILCSSCGQALHRVAEGYHCLPCQRTVRP